MQTGGENVLELQQQSVAMELFYQETRLCIVFNLQKCRIFFNRDPPFKFTK